MKKWFFWGTLQNELELEILKGERLRSLLILVLLATGLALLGIAHIFAGQELTVFFGTRLPTLKIFFIVGLFVLYEVGVFIVLHFCIKKRFNFPLGPRLFNALIETSLPTVGMIFYATLFPPIEALQSPVYQVYYLFIFLSALRMDVFLSLFTSLVAAVGYSFLVLLMIPHGVLAENSGLLYHPAAFMARIGLLVIAGLIVGLVSLQSRRSMEKANKSKEDRNRIYNLFGQHVSPTVVEKLLNQRQEELSENRDVTILFLDIRNFTSYAENRSPEEVVEYLNTLFAFMIDAISRNNGIINKFLGDGFMAVFGAPVREGVPERHAIQAAVEICAELKEKIQQGLIVPTRIGIGIHSGQAVTGSIGSTLRREYTVIGNVVNTASRLEGLNKEVDSQILVSEQVWQAGGSQQLQTRLHGPFTLRGQEAGIMIRQIL